MPFSHVIQNMFWNSYPLLISPHFKDEYWHLFLLKFEFFLIQLFPSSFCCTCPEINLCSWACVSSLFSWSAQETSNFYSCPITEIGSELLSNITGTHMREEEGRKRGTAYRMTWKFSPPISYAICSVRWRPDSPFWAVNGGESDVHLGGKKCWGKNLRTRVTENLMEQEKLF